MWRHSIQPQIVILKMIFAIPRWIECRMWRHSIQPQIVILKMIFASWGALGVVAVAVVVGLLIYWD
jgi:hypothetical protein